MKHSVQTAVPAQAMAKVTPLTRGHLACLSAKSATLASRFYRSAPRMADGLCWRWCPQPDAPPRVVATLSSGDGQIALALDRDVPLNAHSTLDWRNHERDMRVLAFIAAHDTLLEWLQTALGCELAVEGVSDAAGDLPSDAALIIGFSLAHDDGAVVASGLIHAPRRCALRAARALSFGEPALRLTRLPVRMQLEVDRFDVPAHALADLTAGCLVRLTNSSLANDSATVALTAGHWRLPVDVQERTLRLRRIDPIPTRPVAGRHTGYAEMTDTQTDAAPAIAHLESLPVELRFCAGTVTLALAQAQSLRPGQAIALDRGLAESPITVYANDVAVARGDLVLIGDVLGVRIVRTFGTSD